MRFQGRILAMCDRWTGKNRFVCMDRTISSKIRHLNIAFALKFPFSAPFCKICSMNFQWISYWFESISSIKSWIGIFHPHHPHFFLPVYCHGHKIPIFVIYLEKNSQHFCWSNGKIRRCFSKRTLTIIDIWKSMVAINWIFQRKQEKRVGKKFYGQFDLRFFPSVNLSINAVFPLLEIPWTLKMYGNSFHNTI